MKGLGKIHTLYIIIKILFNLSRTRKKIGYFVKYIYLQKRNLPDVLDTLTYSGNENKLPFNMLTTLKKLSRSVTN